MAKATEKKNDAPETYADSDAAKEQVSLAERQDALGAQLRGQSPDDPKIALDQEFRDNWVQQQRKAYPAVYQRADSVRGQSPSAQPGAPVAFGGPVALEPGHDEGKQAEYADLAERGEDGAETAGADNLAPHETTGGGTPSTVITDSTLIATGGETQEQEEVK